MTIRVFHVMIAFDHVSVQVVWNVLRPLNLLFVHDVWLHSGDIPAGREASDKCPLLPGANAIGSMCSIMFLVTAGNVEDGRFMPAGEAAKAESPGQPGGADSQVLLS
jgi:hypothetical protein